MIAEHLRTALAAAADPADAVVAWVGLLEAAMAGSDGLEGCPVAPVAAEAPLAGSAVREAAAAAFASWVTVIAERLAATGHQRPTEAATVVLAAIEGALLMARTSGDVAPLRTVRESVGALLAATGR
jgi:TetR/AcrR family transcriptional repressor of lmrAB and yxaGH operons